MSLARSIAELHSVLRSSLGCRAEVRELATCGIPSDTAVTGSEAATAEDSAAGEASRGVGHLAMRSVASCPTRPSLCNDAIAGEPESPPARFRDFPGPGARRLIRVNQQYVTNQERVTT